MPVDLIAEADLRAALRPFQVDPSAFEAGVRSRLKLAADPAVSKQVADEPLARLSPWLRSAAAFLPLEVLAGCKGTAAAAKLAPVTGGYKLLSYAAFPAISLFVLLGAAVFSVFKIRSIQDQTGLGLSDQEAIREATRQWWRQHKWGAWGVFAASLLLMSIGATWILFLFYLVSFGLLLFVLASFAKLGLGNRAVIGRSCGMGLMFLGQGAAMTGIGSREIHFLDQRLVSAIFYGGVLLLLPYIFGGRQPTGQHVEKTEQMPRWYWVFWGFFGLVHLLLIGAMWSLLGDSRHFLVLLAILVVGALAPALIFKARSLSQRTGNAPRRRLMAFLAILLIPLMAWTMSPILWPATPSRIKHFVESFDEAPFSTASWQKWEIVARWVIDSQLAPDLSLPRRLLAEEIAGEQNPFILSNAMRVGLLVPDQVGQLKDYERQRSFLVTAPPRGMHLSASTILNQDWVIRAAVLRNDLSPQERDVLEQRLLAALDSLSTDQYVTLEKALRATQLLATIERPADRERYGGLVHDLLRRFHCESRHWGAVAGGFRQYPRISGGSVEATAHAVELMEVYGVPDGLDLLWTRSFLRPLGSRKLSDDQWIAAATLDRLNRLPGATRPTWLEVLYYERTLLAALVLVGLCIYATLSSPKLQPAGVADESMPPDADTSAAP